MKGKIVDVHPVALPLRKNGRLLTQKTVLEREKHTQGPKKRKNTSGEI